MRTNRPFAALSFGDPQRVKFRVSHRTSLFCPIGGIEQCSSGFFNLDFGLLSDNLKLATTARASSFTTQFI
jgi:hypothetical protein